MKYFFVILLTLAMGAACKQKVLSGKELENKLKTTMTEHLHKTLKPGTEFTIKDMTYYADSLRKFYICEFSVTVHSGGKDTTGTMKAFIPNDFSKVDRTQ